MDNFRYQLEKYTGIKSRHTCPGCQHKHQFTRYIDKASGEFLAVDVGKCNRVDKCGYHLSPKQYFERNGIQMNQVPSTTFKVQYIPPTKTYIPQSVLKQSLRNYEHNTFIQNLLKQYHPSVVEQIISLYYLGTVSKGYAKGAVTFPFIDEMNRTHAIQVKQFDESNHTSHTDFLHSIIEKNTDPVPDWIKPYNQNEKKISCLFGAHLLRRYQYNKVALVEAPKSAIYGALYFGLPEFPSNLLWLAVYNLSSLTLDKCKALKNRDIILFPDLSSSGKAFELWTNKSKELEDKIPGARFTVSDLLENNASQEDREKGLDIADYLFRLKNENRENREAVNKTFFNGIPVPMQVKLNEWSTITNVPKFIQSHLSFIKTYKKRTICQPYIDSLNELAEAINIPVSTFLESEL